MDNIIGNKGEVQFANGQSSRDLRATLCGAEQETQLMEAVDNVGTSLVSSRFQREWMQKRTEVVLRWKPASRNTRTQESMSSTRG